MEWLAKLYADTMNIIHFMHDKVSTTGSTRLPSLHPKAKAHCKDAASTPDHSRACHTPPSLTDFDMVIAASQYDYEKTEMALHDTFIRRFLAFGISGYVT